MATLAERQLAAWEAIALDWPVFYDGPVARCPVCMKGMWLARDTNGKPYRHTPDQLLAQTVIHLRNHHADLDPDPHD